MTVEIELAPELESFARAQAQEQFQGDVAAFITAVIQSQMNASEYDEEVDQQLLAGLNSSAKPVSENWCEEVRQKAHALSAK
ncbi:MAG: hypothetical protein QM703_10655 [Gemmatales bacterium]